jgi:hypothetical protein
VPRMAQLKHEAVNTAPPEYPSPTFASMLAAESYKKA